MTRHRPAKTSPAGAPAPPIVGHQNARGSFLCTESLCRPVPRHTSHASHTDTSLVASAHEVYVLDQTTVLRDVAAQSPNPFTAYTGNEADFFLGYRLPRHDPRRPVCVALPTHREQFDSVVRRLKRLAHPMARVTCGVCLIASGYYGALFRTRTASRPTIRLLRLFLCNSFSLRGRPHSDRTVYTPRRRHTACSLPFRDQRGRLVPAHLRQLSRHVPVPPDSRLGHLVRGKDVRT